ncbi:protein of unknown function DUF820 [Gloeothece citriformis PCC 7424]|uniref:Putative restriction endonuclease domain-containing protein n=1 Tax=Gloeothece citriformis (strain PCC 7424) TaxID=65393 RepID=B7KF88_GLOC7|nr:Uma2 family endonuclease [Gloeothece citriformis]ACK71804.1 protein of unknown function DUF820 [Gloeothece citriformis PCC 7424]
MITVISSPRNQIVLQGVRWETYKALVQDMEGQPGKRLTYDSGRLEIMTPLPIHETYKKLIDRFIEVTTEEMNLEIRSLGSCTWSREDLAQGLEPDECYYVEHELAVRGKTEIDLNNDPPPDLAIEIDITSSSLNRLQIYAALGVSEVWRYDGKTLIFYRLVEEEYQSQERSEVLPLLSRGDILRFLEQHQNMGETSLIRSFREWVREQLAQNK